MKKYRAGYKKKRKYRGNQHSNTPEENQKRRKTDRPIDTCDASSSTDQGNQRQKLSASARKIHLEHTIELDVDKLTSQKSKVSGFRLIDLEILASVCEQLPCKDCFEPTVTLVEEIFKRKGCASALRLVCSSCGWSSNFNSSKQVSRFYEVKSKACLRHEIHRLWPCSGKTVLWYNEHASATPSNSIFSPQQSPT